MGNKMHLGIRLSSIIMIMLCLLVFTSQSQEIQDDRNSVYVCIFDGGVSNIMEVRASEPFGLIFAKSTNIVVYSESDFPITVNIFHVDADRITGTYRRVADIGTANTTLDIPSQSDCGIDHSQQLAGLERTFLIRVSSEQGIAIYPEDNNLFENPSTAIIGSIGMIPTNAFDEEQDVSFPAFQLLRFSGGNNDTISLKFAELTEFNDFYVVSRQLVSHTLTSPANNTSQDDIMETLPFFLELLDSIGVSLVDDIMNEGKFRMYIEYGEIIQYREDHLLNFSRLSSVAIRDFAENDIIEPLNCDYPVPYFREADYNQNIYFVSPRPSVGTIRCGEDTAVEEVLDNGILIVEGGFYIASWLVDIVE